MNNYFRSLIIVGRQHPGRKNFIPTNLKRWLLLNSKQNTKCIFQLYIFTVVTDCNALTATSKKKDLIPRIARWWLRLQQYSFEKYYRPGISMKYVNVLSRNYPRNTTKLENILQIQPAGWLLFPAKRHQSKRKQSMGPKGMRHQIVKYTNDDGEHFSKEKTVLKLDENQFPKNETVRGEISLAVYPVYTTKEPREKGGVFTSIKKACPLTLFSWSKNGKLYIIVGTDAFTKFLFLTTIKNTHTQSVIQYLKDILVALFTEYFLFLLVYNFEMMLKPILLSGLMSQNRLCINVSV